MWQTIIINPLTAILHFFLNFSGDIGIAIVLFTVVIKFVLLPLNIQAAKTSKNLRKIQDDINKLKEKHKKDTRALGADLSKLYKDNDIRPLSGILNLFIQIPILFGLYHIILKELAVITDKTTLFNIDITQKSIFFAVLTLISMFILMRLSVKDMQIGEKASQFQKDFSRMMQLQMQYFLPLLVFLTSLFLPAGITIYFVVSNIFGIFQTLFIKKVLKI
jgi:YidC/Oxa1 family membrane protein insertase